MAEINNREDLERWLESRPPEDAVVLAARAALRALLLLVADLDEDAGKRRAALSCHPVRPRI